MKVWLLFIFIFSSFVINAGNANDEKPYKVYLRPGSELISIKDRSRVILEKGIYANVLETNPVRREWFSVYGKDGKAQYITKANSVAEVMEDVRVLPNVNAEISYPPPVILNGHNKDFYFDTQFNIHLDSIDITPLNTLYSQNLSAMTANRFELRTLYSSELPVNFGLGINFQDGRWTNENDNVKFTVLSIGPQIQRYIYEGEELAVSLHLGAEFAPIYTTKSGESVEKYRAMLLDLGIEALWGTRFGKWSIGAHFRRHDITLTSTTRPEMAPVPEEYVINSIGGLIGYKYEWEL